MRALSGYAEWFWLICKSWKDVENRNWSLPHVITTQLPCRIYLHASKTPASDEEIDFIIRQLTSEQYDEFRNVNWNALRGNIIGETTITGQMMKRVIRESDHVDVGSQQKELEILEREKHPYLSRWFFGKFGFICKDGQLYGKPIPYKGQLGFFEVNVTKES